VDRVKGICDNTDPTRVVHIIACEPRAAISSTGNSGEKQGQENVRNASYRDPARRFAKKGGSGRRVSERMRDQKIQRRDYNTISRRTCTSYVSSSLFLSFFFSFCRIRNTSVSHYRRLIGIIIQFATGIKPVPRARLFIKYRIVTNTTTKATTTQ